MSQLDNTCVLVFGHVDAADGTVAQGGVKPILPLLTTSLGGGGMPPRLYHMDLLPLCDYCLPPPDILTKPITTTDGSPPETSCYISTSPSNSPNRPRAEHPVVGSSCNYFLRQKGWHNEYANQPDLQVTRTQIYFSWNLKWGDI